MIKIYSFLVAGLLFANLNAQPGTLDLTFDPGTGANNEVYTTSRQPDGKIIIGGGLTMYNGTQRNRIARLNADGTLDTSFDPGTGANGAVRSAVIQPDGKIIIGGSFTEYNGTGRNNIARLNADGTLDPNFDPGTGANGAVRSAVIQPDGKIIIGGDFFQYNGTVRNRIARLNTDGTLDTNFDPGSGASATVLTTVIQPDGKIIIGGGFTSYNGTSRNRIARLNADGTLDTSFNPGTGANISVLTIAIQPDGKIIIGGQFTEYNGTGRNRISRVNADGTLDTNFDPGSGANIQIRTTAIQPDGKIIIGGDFTDYNGTGRNRIARLNTDGTLDTSFDPGSGLNNGWIGSTVPQPDGKIIIGGDFFQYNGTGRSRIARVNGENCVASTGTDVQTACDSFTWIDGNTYNSSNNTATHTLTNAAGCDSIVTLNLTINQVSDVSTTLTGITITANNNNASSYQWIDCDNGNAPIVGANNQSYTATSNGNYAVEITQNGCTATSTCVAVTTLGISENEAGDGFYVYPNPASDQINIVLQKPEIVEIYSISGKLIERYSPMLKHTIDVSVYSQGVYLIKSGNQTQRFIKQ
jgi:uncharacterized delta-60 repeat protein